MGLFELHKPQIHNEGIWADHDMPCATCHKKAAIMDCQTEIFYPCRDCQKEGWNLYKPNKFIQWLLKE